MTTRFFLSLFALLSFLPGLSQHWKQIGETLYGETADAHFGSSVTLSSNGRVMAVGARRNSFETEQDRVIELFENINGNWIKQDHGITWDRENEEGGYSIAMNSDGTVLAIGIPYNFEKGWKSGLVRVYKNNNGNWEQMGQIIYSEEEGDKFGSGVCLSTDGTILAVGAPENDGGGIDSGHIRVYAFTDGAWVQTGDDIDGEAEHNYLGYYVCLSADGSIMATGADGNAENGFYAGHARVYENIEGEWVQIGEDIDGEKPMDYSGYCVDLNADGSIFAVGSTGSDGNGFLSGCVRVYKNNAGNWIQLGQTIYGEGENDRLGADIRLSADGNTLALGADSNSGNGENAGHVRVYKLFPHNNRWLQVGDDLDGEAEEERFGNSVDLSADGETLVVGAYQNDEVAQNAGQVKIFQLVQTHAKSQARAAFSFYPNPVKNNVQLVFPNSIKNRLIRISDLSGRNIFEKKGEGTREEMDLSALTNGIYLMQVFSDSEMQSKPFVKVAR